MKFKFTVPKIKLFDNKKAGKIISFEMRKTLNSMLGAVKSRAQMRAPVGATGNLRGSITDTIKQSGTIMTGIVGANAKYSSWVNSGRGAAKKKGNTKAFLESLIKWMKSSTAGSKFFLKYKTLRRRTEKKKKVFFATKSTVRKTKQKDLYMEAAIFLKMRINKSGTKANKFFDRAIKDSTSYIKKLNRDLLPNIKLALQGLK